MGVTSFLLTDGVLPDGLPDQWEWHLLRELDGAAHVRAGRVLRCPICPRSLVAAISERTAGRLHLPTPDGRGSLAGGTDRCLCPVPLRGSDGRRALRPSAKGMRVEDLLPALVVRGEHLLSYVVIPQRQWWM